MWPIAQPVSDAQVATVDVVIAARDEAARIGECLESIAVQDYPADRLRVIVVDNGSRDDTAAIARRRGAYVATEATPGAAAARNLGSRSGQGALVAFLDAHCVISPEWIRLMAAKLDDPAVGAAQARIDSRADDPRLARFLDRSGVQSNARLVDATVRGKHNVYPWILSGNCVYRREALELAGGFDESLSACEDVDLAWRVVLLGYRLAYEDRAVAVHHSGGGWGPFLTKGRRYGQAAAVLARRYLPSDADNGFTPSALWNRDLGQTASALAYWVGYREEAARMRLRGPAPAPSPVPAAALERFRRRFSWDETRTMQIDPRVVFWFRDDLASVVVHRDTRARFVLDGAADLIWRALTAGHSRAATVTGLVDRYGIAPQTACADLDDLVDELTEAQILRRAPATA